MMHLLGTKRMLGKMKKKKRMYANEQVTESTNRLLLTTVRSLSLPCPSGGITEYI